LGTDGVRFLAALFALGGTACVDQVNFTPTAKELVVHAVLDATSRDQYVVVQAANGALRDESPVAGAIVTITTPDGRRLTADEVHDSTLFGVTAGMPRVTTAYRISLDRAGVALTPGGTYLLRVVVPDGREVTGATTIPNASPNSAAPTAMTLDRSRDTLRLDWARVNGASAYEVFVSSSRTRSAVFTDTSVALLARAQNNDGASVFVAGANTVVVSAVDQNYYDYFRHASDPYTGTGVISHLSGGLGVFGSIVPIASRSVTVR
jgi:hypothetical protein